MPGQSRQQSTISLSDFNYFLADQWGHLANIFTQDNLFDSKIISDVIYDTLLRVQKTFFEQEQMWDERQKLYLVDLERLQLYGYERLLGVVTQPVIVPKSNDRRFLDDMWRDAPFFDCLKQFYLLTYQYVMDVLDTMECQDEDQKKRLHFFGKNVMDAFSPSNFPLTNPKVWKETLRTNGANLVEGMKKFIDDLHQGRAFSLIGHVRSDTFELGKNLATTPGHVVFQNYLIQVIYYKPKNKKTFKKPVCIVPPWINKYYIFDLQEKNSFVKWLTDQDIPVFTISWVNPTADYAHVSLRDYVIDGVLEALSFIFEEMGESVNLMGYCSGGCLAAITSSYLEYTQNPLLSSLTLLATPGDFDKMGDLRIFVSPEQVANLEESLFKYGVLDGESMVKTFSWLRSNDLIWGNFVNTYLLNQDRQTMDFLFWNCDCTNIPATMHLEYLRHIFLENGLIKKNHLTIEGIPIDLTSISVPTYVLAAKSDHIVPYASAYAYANLVEKAEFVLTAAGHVAGIINHPDDHKYVYWVGGKNQNDAEIWAESAEEKSGSWWCHWVEWLKPSLGKMHAVNLHFKTIEKAPGCYALARCSKIA